MQSLRIRQWMLRYTETGRKEEGEKGREEKGRERGKKERESQYIKIYL